MLKALALGILAVSLGCASTSSTDKFIRNRYVANGIVLPNSMCARHGVQAASKDAPGNRMLCEMQEVLGSRLVKCVCWDESIADQSRQLNQQAVIDSEINKCMPNGGTCAMPGPAGRSGGGH